MPNWNNAWNQPYASNSIYNDPTTSGVGTFKGDLMGFGGGNSDVSSAIKGLLTPGLVPDIARQSAEVSAGRGVAGSPAGGSTAVRMSEQNWLQRLGLANTLLSGEAGRTLPYQITPYQQADLDLRRKLLQIQQQQANRPPNLPSFGGGGGRGSGGEYPFANFPGFGGAHGSSDGGWPNPTGGGGFGGGGQQPSLDDMLDELGLGDSGYDDQGGGDADWDFLAE